VDDDLFAFWPHLQGDHGWNDLGSLVGCDSSPSPRVVHILATGFMDISDWRKKIDELDCKLVDLLSQRSQAAHEIGKLKRGMGMPIYEPDREQAVFDNVRSVNPGTMLPGKSPGEIESHWTSRRREQLGVYPAGPPPRCQLTAPPSRREREKDGAPTCVW
jgi:chorismate mutase